jgi:hypothetical protein
MVEIDHDFEVAGWRGRRLVHDRDLFLLGAALEGVAQAEEPGRDNRSRGRASKAVNGSAAGVALFAIDVSAVGRLGFGPFGFVVDAFGLAPIEVLHDPTVRPISDEKAQLLGPSLPLDHGGEP